MTWQALAPALLLVTFAAEPSLDAPLPTAAASVPGIAPDAAVEPYRPSTPALSPCQGEEVDAPAIPVPVASGPAGDEPPPEVPSCWSPWFATLACLVDNDSYMCDVKICFDF